MAPGNQHPAEGLMVGVREMDVPHACRRTPTTSISGPILAGAGTQGTWAQKPHL